MEFWKAVKTVKNNFTSTQLDKLNKKECYQGKIKIKFKKAEWLSFSWLRPLQEIKSARDGLPETGDLNLVSYK